MNAVLRTKKALTASHPNRLFRRRCVGVQVAQGVLKMATVAQVRHRRFRREIDSRAEDSAQWSAEFPNDMFVVDRILTIFCDAFMFDARSRFKFRPDDRIMEIYKQTTGPIADEMQLERLRIEIAEAFAVDLDEELNETTRPKDIVRVVTERFQQDRLESAP